MKLVRSFIIICFLGNLVIFALWSILQQPRNSEWINSDRWLQLSRLVVPVSILGIEKSEKNKLQEQTSWSQMLLGKRQEDDVNSTFDNQPNKRLITPGDKEKQLRLGLGNLRKKTYVEFGQESEREEELVHDTPPQLQEEAQTGSIFDALWTKDEKVPEIEPSKSDLSTLDNTLPTTQKKDSDHWQPVVVDVLYVFSAYVNEVEFAAGAVVEVLGMKKTAISELHVKCVLRYESGEPETTVAGRMSDIGNENTKRVLAYQAATTVCPLPDTRIPKSCSLLLENSVPNTLQIHYNEKYSYVEGSIHVCFAPFYNMYNDVSHVTEFVELNFLLGVSHFTFFNLSIGPGLNKVLHHYRQQGIATILQYHLPHPREIHIRGHHVTVHDCKMRHRGTAEYLVLIDPDETIFPMQFESLLPQLRKLDSPAVSGFIFPCLYFCMEETDNKTALSYMNSIKAKYPDAPAYPFHLWTQLKTINMHKPCRITKNRINKIILKPWNVTRTSIHYILSSATGTKPVIVPTEAATLHHYRTCQSGGHLPYPDVCAPRDKPVVDVVAHRYMQKLAKTVYQVMRRISGLE